MIVKNFWIIFENLLKPPPQSFLGLSFPFSQQTPACLKMPFRSHRLANYNLSSQSEKPDLDPACHLGRSMAFSGFKQLQQWVHNSHDLWKGKAIHLPVFKLTKLCIRSLIASLLGLPNSLKLLPQNNNLRFMQKLCEDFRFWKRLSQVFSMTIWKIKTLNATCLFLKGKVFYLNRKMKSWPDCPKSFACNNKLDSFAK